MSQHACRAILGALLGSIVAGCGVTTDSAAGPFDGKAATAAEATAAVPRAECGPGSNPETGLQGQVSLADRQSGRALDGYSCNLEVLGKWQHGEGASWQFAWYDDCGYYGTLRSDSRVTDFGAVVVDASDPAHPVETALLQTPAVTDPHESLKVNERRGLLGAVDSGNAFFDLYDVSKDCAHPELLASVDVGQTVGHEGDFSSDGLTYYGSPSAGLPGQGQVAAIAIEDPAHPEIFYTIPNYPSHGLSTSDDGNRLYAASAALQILDVSSIQSRAPNPSVTPIAVMENSYCNQHTVPVTIGGKPYLICVSEGKRDPANIIDISDEANPTVASYLELEVHLPENAGLDARDGGVPLFVYEGHYCYPDQLHEPTVLGCGYFESGIRVFDIRDPLHPKEIAYYHPPPITDRPLPASSHGGGTADRCTAQVRFRKTADGGGQLWTQCQDNEFLILKFTNGVWPFAGGT